MGEIVNLNKARKDRAKSAAKVKAAGNRALFGRPKVEKSRLELELEKARSFLDQHKRDD
jgi:hypothetical protein